MRLTITLSMPREPASVAMARHVLVRFLDAAAAPQECRVELGLVVTEACANAVMHAIDDRPIEISIGMGPGECVIEVGNSIGEAVPGVLPTEMPHPLAGGGRGLPFIAAFTDDARFVTPRPGWIVLRIVKRLGVEPDGGIARPRAAVTDHGRSGT